MGLDFSAEFVEVLHDGAVYGACEVRMLVCNIACLVPNIVIHILVRKYKRVLHWAAPSR